MTRVSQPSEIECKLPLIWKLYFEVVKFNIRPTFYTNVNT